MLTLSPVWHGRLRAVNRVRNLLLQTLVIHPALLSFIVSVAVRTLFRRAQGVRV
ncbi:hypothetical protein FHW04_003836 [Pantoea sp. AN62]|uniref:hypothetical protein n=1 Tax=Pantoea TaxID=53335 RepID=UPI001301B703|nr:MULTISPECIES: hypothetical protein [Pantoea]MDU4747877.1 hypothetical protein [Pantoea sp.]HCR0227211.1 hypothetical protein [Enterobacter kobei]HCR0505830.1 hypothetical protein [Enterobacter kobei]HCR0864739.1 hypothetical protein [Enterobacter kobei]